MYVTPTSVINRWILKSDMLHMAQHYNKMRQQISLPTTVNNYSVISREKSVQDIRKCKQAVIQYHSAKICCFPICMSLSLLRKGSSAPESIIHVVETTSNIWTESKCTSVIQILVNECKTAIVRWTGAVTDFRGGGVIHYVDPSLTALISC